MKKFFILLYAILFISIILPGFLTAQSTAQEIENLLNTNAVTYAQAVRFVLEASSSMVTSSQEEAYNYAVLRNWLPKKASLNDIARLDGLSLLFMQSFDLKGGIFYSIAKNPHYAYRELVYRDVIQGRADPGMKVSGERLLFITSRILSQSGDVMAIAAGNDRQGQLVTDAARRAETAARRTDETARDMEAAARRAEEAAARVEEAARRTEEAAVRAEMAARRSEEAAVREANIRPVESRASESRTPEGRTSSRVLTVYFQVNSSELSDFEMRKVQDITNDLRNTPGRRIQIAGHTADTGDTEAEARLSRLRAQTVASYLVSGGVRQADITVIGYGAEFPIADNAAFEGMIINRRVEIIILED